MMQIHIGLFGVDHNIGEANTLLAFWAMKSKRIIRLASWIVVMIGLFQLLILSEISAQNLIAGDPSDSYDTETLFINPAVVAFHRPQVMVGMKVYQFGFLKSNDWSLRSSYLSFSLPEESWRWFSLAVTGQNFAAPLYSQTNISLLLAKQPFKRIAIGLKYNLFAKAYHRKEFDMVDPGDPVFANGTTKFAQSFGVGVIVFPWSLLSVGFSCDHINRPDVSLYLDQYQQPRVYDWGVGYSWRWFTSSLYFNFMQGHWQTNWALEVRPAEFSTIKLGFVQQAAKFTARLKLSSRLTLNYAFDYPLYEINRLSNGSHQVGFVYELSHDEKTTQLLRSRYDQGHFPQFDIESQFFVKIETDKLEILSQQIRRHVDDDVPTSALNNLNEVELVINDSLVETSNIYQHGGAMNQQLPALSTAPRYSQKYEAWLADHLLKRKINLLRFLPEENAVERARNLRDFLVVHAPFLADRIQLEPILHGNPNRKDVMTEVQRRDIRQNYQLTPNTVCFKISSIKMRNYQGPWKLEIINGEHQVIKTFAGAGAVPKQIQWDWRDDQGHLIGPDVYRYAISWRDKQGHWRTSDEEEFYVQKISRRLDIEVRTQPKPGELPGEVVEIKFVN